VLKEEHALPSENTKTGSRTENTERTCPADTKWRTENTWRCEVLKELEMLFVGLWILSPFIYLAVTNLDLVQIKPIFSSQTLVTMVKFTCGCKAGDKQRKRKYVNWLHSTIKMTIIFKNSRFQGHAV
jgi:hypothetical protein